LREKSNKQVKELNKTIQDLKLEIETIKKSQKETTLKIENLGKKISNKKHQHHQQNTRDRISDAEDTIENIDTTVKENENAKAPSSKIKEILHTVRRLNLRIIGIEGSKDSQFKGPVNIFK
jgi:molecular chaperone GrpE (heat shock protein)